MNRIGRRIVSGQYRVGDALPSELALCEEHGLSRTPLREAMKKLHAKGLIVMAPKSGTRVLPPENWNQLDPDLLRWRFETGPDEALLAQLYELRMVFEPEACRLAAINGEPARHAEIARQFELMALTHNDPNGIVEPDIDFHMAIFAATQNVFLVSVSAAIKSALRLQFHLSAERKKFPKGELEQHRLICDAIIARDGETAARRMRDLVSLSRESLTRALRAAVGPIVKT